MATLDIVAFIFTVIVIGLTVTNKTMGSKSCFVVCMLTLLLLS